MPWVVDERRKQARDAAINELGAAISFVMDAERGERAIESRTRAVLGVGHRDTDRLMQNANEARQALQHVMSTIDEATAALRKVDIWRWEKEYILEVDSRGNEISRREVPPTPKPLR